MPALPRQPLDRLAVRCARALVALWLLAIAACEDLPAIARNECGNRVVETGEECDEPGPGCHGPESPFACRFDCTTEACPEGLGCGVDHVCRGPSGRFETERFETGDYTGWVYRADLNGDRRDDLTIGGRRGFSIAFDASRAARITRNEAVAGMQMMPGDVNGDGRVDMVSYDELAIEVQVLTSDADGQLVPVSHVVPGPEGQARKLFSGNLDGQHDAEPLLLVDDALYRVSATETEFVFLGTSSVSAANVAGFIPTGDFAKQTPCDEFVLAERGTNLVSVYTLCGAVNGPTLLSTVALPMDRVVSDPGAFAGDMDGDGRLDLIISTSEFEFHVAYGLGDGTFDSAENPPPGALGDQTTTVDPSNYQARVLGVAQLDADGRADLMMSTATLLTTLITPECERPNDLTCLLFHDEWATAVAGDFNHDGIADQIGVPLEARELTFALGTGSGFNEFAVLTRGKTASWPDVVDYNLPQLSVGDFDGNLTPDVAFAEQTRTTPPQVSVTVLYGQALEEPREQRTLATERAILGLAAGSLDEGDGSSLSDLVMLAESTASGIGVGLFRGKTNRLMFSPLPIPEQAATRQNLELQMVALGRFRSSEPRLDMVMTADSTVDRLLYFVPNSSEGFVSAPGREVPLRLPEQSGHRPLITELDVDGDGIDELIVVPSTLVTARLPYWVLRRVDNGFESDGPGFGIELPALAGLQDIWLSLPHHPRDLSGDGRVDLVVNLMGYAEEQRAFQLVVESLHERRLGTAHVFEVPPEPGDFGAWIDGSVVGYLQTDSDPESELALAAGTEIRVYDMEFESDALRLSRVITADTFIYELTAGDFDGDGVSDLAVTMPSLQMFWGQAAEP